MRGNHAALTVPKASGEPPLTNPITGIVGRRARALNGHAAAPPPSSEELAPFLLMEMHLLPLASKEQHNGFASIESGLCCNAGFSSDLGQLWVLAVRKRKLIWL
jgi:hypothetical protein